jgi:hypothetical protein
VGSNRGRELELRLVTGETFIVGDAGITPKERSHEVTPMPRFIIAGGRGLTETWTLVGPDRETYASDQPGPLGGHRRSRIYGRLDCPAALRAIARGGYVARRVFFLTEDHARAASYRPCGVCLPAAYASWKAETPTNSTARLGVPDLPAMTKLQTSVNESRKDESEHDYQE